MIGGNVVKKYLFRCLEATLPDGRSDCKHCRDLQSVGIGVRDGISRALMGRPTPD